MKYIKLTICLFAWLISYLLPLIILLSETGTCNQGSTDEYLVSAFLFIIIIIIVIPTVHMLHKEFSGLWWMSLFHLTTLVSYFLVIPKYFFYTTVKGYSLCHGNPCWNDFSSCSSPRGQCLPAEAGERMFAIIITTGLFLIIFYMAKIIKHRFRTD